LNKKEQTKICIKGLCKAIEGFCKTQNCEHSSSLEGVRGLYILAFFEDGKIRMHTIGGISPLEMADACNRSLIAMQEQMRGEKQDYAT